MKNYSLNIFGSTGEIGSKSINIINKYYNSIKINLLVANKNYKKLIHQTNLIKPKHICLLDNTKYEIMLRLVKSKKTKIIHPNDLIKFLNKNYSNITLLSISGYNALNYLLPIIKNTKILGIVNKECIVSAGHLLKSLSKKFNTDIFPIDSEHYSLFNYFNSTNNLNHSNIKSIFLTASGGPFYKKNNKNFSVLKALKHPKWKMGYKNSIDSSTLTNKCLEIIEAHYLFNIPYEKLKIIIHPEALVHSIIEFNNSTSIMNYFYHDMSIPISNFLKYAIKNKGQDIYKKKYNFKLKNRLDFDKPKISNYPILKTFYNLKKNNPINVIKFNCANEMAVELFIKKMINFRDINKFIDKSLSLDLHSKVNTINNIIKFHNEYAKLLQSNFYMYNIKK